MDPRRRSDPPPEDSATLSGARPVATSEAIEARADASITLGGSAPSDRAITSPDATMPSAATSPETAGLRPVPREVFVVEGEHARGGVGRVLLAHEPGLDRRVAIKESLRDDPSAVARFVREARLTARLQHPNIVPVYQAGRWPSGEPFYAMRLISGRSLASVVKATRTLEERLPLVPDIIAIADAIAYAHSQRIIHRDIKPDNVIIGAFGETIVVDWGLAKDLAAELQADEAVAFGDVRDTGSGNLTVAGARVGTPAYMAPEQARGEPVDERADVFALGALMYHVLAGEPPFRGPNVDAVLAMAARGTPVDIEAAQPDVPRDLATIVRKATAPIASERYPSARELADDLRRFQSGQLVSARRYSRWSIVARWLRRHRLPAGIALLSLVALTVTLTLSVQRVVRERNRAEARTGELILAQAKLTLDHDPTTAAAWIQSYPQDAIAWSEARVLADDARHMGIARHALHLSTPLGPTMVTLARDGHLAAVGQTTFDRWDARGASVDHAILGATRLSRLVPESGALVVMTLEGNLERTAHPGAVATKLATIEGARAMEVSSDGAWIALVGDGGLVVVSADGAKKKLEAPPSPVVTIAISPDGSHVAVSTDDAAAWMWDVATGARARLPGTLAKSVAPLFFASGSRLAAAGDDRSVWVWDVATARPTTLRGHEHKVVQIAASPDGVHLASADGGNVVRLWNTDRGDGHVAGAHAGYVVGLAFSPDGDLLASSAQDEITRMYRVSTGDTALLRGHGGLDVRPVFSPDGRSIATAGGGQIRVWDVVPPEGRTLRGHPGRVTNVAFSPDSRLVATCSERRVTLWDAASGRAVGGGEHDGDAYGIAFSRDGHLVASTTMDGPVGLWDTRGGGRILRGHEGRSYSALFTPDGASLVTAGRDGTLRIWDVASGAGRVLGRTEGAALRIDLSPDGRTVASIGQDRKVRAWDVATGAARIVGTHGSDPYYVVFLDPTKVLVASAEHVRIYDLGGGAPRDLPLPEGFEGHVAASPSGRHVAFSIDERFALFDLATGESRILRGHDREVQRLRFSDDGTRIVSGGIDGTTRIWDLATYAVHTVHRHDGVVFDAVVSPDGRLVASASADKTAWVGPIGDDRSALRDNAAEVRAALARWTTVTIGARNQARSP